MDFLPDERLRGAVTQRCAIACWLLALGAFPAMAASTTIADEPTRAASQELAWQLAARHANEGEQLVGSPFGRPIALTSQVKDSLAQGEAIAELEVPLPVLRAALTQPQRWCEILLLTPPIGRCVPIAGGADARLDVEVLHRYDGPRDDAASATIRLHRGISDRHYLSLQLRAPRGPLGTSDYRLDIQAAALEEGRSVLRVGYAYEFGIQAAAAMGWHLATSGRDKLGFSQDAQERPTRGLRGSVERDVMRYFLAIEAHVLQKSSDPAQRFENSLARWLTAIDHYPERLAEPAPERYRQIKLDQFSATP